MGRHPLTGDAREDRFFQYIKGFNKGQLREAQLVRLNRVANFRKQLMELLTEFIETRAEILAIAMLMETAPERPEPAWKSRRGIEAAADNPPHKRRMPKWMKATKKHASGWRAS